MMAGSATDPLLPGRLVRLSSEEPSCCVQDYTELAREVVDSPRFATSLGRAKALADSSRLLAVSLLKRRRELCACEIQAATGLTHATVSHHMSVLVEAGLVRERRQGKWMYYRLSDETEVRIP